MMPEALPLQEVLQHVQWSARATCRAFQRDLEAGRRKLKLNLPPTHRGTSTTSRLNALLSRLLHLTAVECVGCHHIPAALARCLVWRLSGVD